MTDQTKQLNFHGDDVEPSPPQDALFHVIPVPMECSVSYGAGTAAGPQAILEASAQLELLTGHGIPAQHGIHTTEPVDCDGDAEMVLGRIERRVADTLAERKIPVILGGEHTVTCGVIADLQKVHQDFGVVQFDAHADLRDSYEGSAYSHACVMRRIHERGIPLCQLGTRSYSMEEDEYRRRHRIWHRDAEDIRRNGIEPSLPPDFPQKVYITFDVDSLDSAVMPATGTPVPGGLDWYETMWLLESILKNRICLGFDVVELAPIAHLHHASFTAAQLTYNLMGLVSAGAANRQYHHLA